MKSAPRKTTKTNTYHGPTPMGLTHWIVFWSLVLCTLVVINAAFAKYQKPMSEVAMEADIAAAIADNLEKQADMLEDQAEALQQEQQIQTVEVECYMQDPGPAETYFTYFDTSRSVRMSLPYSFSWKKNYCTPVHIQPSDEGDRILFGPTINAGDQTRDSELSILEATSTNAVRTKLKSLPYDPPITIRERSVNGLTVLSYQETSMPGASNWIAVGRNYTYEIRSYRWLTDAEAIKIIQSLRVTK